MPPHSSIATALTALFALTVAACDSMLSPTAELSEARRRWDDRGPASYSIDVFRSCECTSEMAGPVVVNVQNGVVESRYYRAGGLVPANLVAAFPAVAGLFDLIVDAQQRNAHRLEVRYDPDLGYPARVAIDYDRQTVDDEVTYSVMAFQRR